MAFSSLIIIVFLFLLTALLVMRPFLEEGQGREYPTSNRYDSLVAERERLYGAIEELELDLELNKISSQEYESGRRQLLIQAAAVLEEMEKTPSGSVKVVEEGWPPIGDEELERMISERRKAIQGPGVKICPSCGKAILPEDQFCSHCGARL